MFCKRLNGKCQLILLKDKQMKKRKAFTLIELLVVIAIIALLLAILVPSLQKVKEKGQAVVCAANLRQWNLLVGFFLTDNEGEFPDADYHDNGTGDDIHGQWWIQPLKPYNGTPKILLCAKAKVHPNDVPGERAFPPSKANECWGSRDQAPNPTAGEWTWASYAPNAWMMNPKDGTWGALANLGEFWGKIENVTAPFQVPLFLDSRWVDVWPLHTDMPNSQEWGGSGGQGYMRQLIVTRHGKATNVVFMDGSAKRVPLIELWGLKWHAKFDTGYADGNDWPSWMR